MLKDASGRPVRLSGINFDITERKRVEDLRASEAALREADQRKNEFLGVLSHELRNPLAPIRSAIAVLGHADSASVQARRARDILARQVEHLTRLVEDLLEVRRIETGKLRLRTGMVDLAELVRETVEDIRPFFVQRSLNLTFDAPPARIWVNGDRTRLVQVASNLLHNASKFTERGGNVVVTVETHGGEAQLQVRDDGIGIAPELVGVLFKAFVQGEKTLDRSRGGLGLGLSLVRGIAELHGGSVAARSEGVGKGSEFIVRLPTTEAPAPATAEAEPPSASRTSRRRVLVVEDNQDAAEALRDLLEVLGGHEVNVAYDGESGVDAIQRYTPDIVLCDLGLPGIDGYEVARRVRADGVSARARLVALSGYASADDIERALRAGFDYHVAKPPDARRLLDLVADAGAATAATLPTMLATGYGELDFRHGSILADVALLRSASTDRGALLESLRSLERHAVADFDYEEEVMENMKYAHLDAHRQHHHDFLGIFGRLQEKVHREGPTPENVHALAYAVETWLPSHIADEDRRFAEFVRGQIKGAA